MCVLRMFPDLSLWLRPTDIVPTQIILGGWWRLSSGHEMKPSEGAVVSSSEILHHSKVRPVRLFISHELVMRLGSRQPSSLPVWEALWLRPSVTFLQQTINGAPSTPPNSSLAWFQVPADGSNPRLTPQISRTSPPSSIPTTSVTARLLRVNLKIKILGLREQHFGVIIDNIYGVTHNSCYFRRVEGNGRSKTTFVVFLFIGCHLQMLWFIHSHSTHLFSILRDDAVLAVLFFPERWIFFFFFLIFISCWIWETSFSPSPNHCTPFFFSAC